MIDDYRRKFAEDVREKFPRDVANHIVVQYHNDGDVGRLWKCHNPKSTACHFWISAPPGWLMIYGDMGECMWSRLHDMIPFIRGSIESTSYFHEKSSRDCRTKEHSTEMVSEWLQCVEQEWEDYHGEPMSESKREILEELEGDWDGEDVEGFIRKIYDAGLFYDSESIPSFQHYTFHYLWQCKALDWFVKQLDAGNVLRLNGPFSWESGKVTLQESPK